MAKRYTRQKFLDRLWGEIKAGKPLVMTGAGNGIAAKFIERGGIDIIDVNVVEPVRGSTRSLSLRGHVHAAGGYAVASAEDVIGILLPGNIHLLPRNFPSKHP